ncbi:F-box only protein 47 [Branchiostoma belcheri]|nr:F-box only protein 47 [Branchiostoma belcheri]
MLKSAIILKDAARCGPSAQQNQRIAQPQGLSRVDTGMDGLCSPQTAEFGFPATSSQLQTTKLTEFLTAPNLSHLPCYSPSMLPGETHNPLQEAAEADAPPCRCQKTRRRSSRLIFKERSLSNSRAIQDGPLGFFQILPMEMVYNILYELTIVDLSVLTIVSKAVRGLVECFMDSKRGEERLLLRVSLHKPASQDHAGLMQHFRRLGVLQKRATCLYTTRDRLRIIEQFIQKMDLMSCFGCSNQCLALTCYGRFLHTVIAGWDQMECLRVYVLVNTHVQRRLNQVLHSAHGCHGDDELYLRLFYRRVLLDQCEHQLERAFWLSRMLSVQVTMVMRICSIQVAMVMMRCTCGCSTEESCWTSVNTPYCCHGDDELYLRLFYRRVLLDQCEHQQVAMVMRVCSTCAGCHGDDELYLRLFYRRVLLDQCEHQLERAFWLSRMLKPLPMVHQARLLFILYGPVCFYGDSAVWMEMGDEESNTPASTVVLAELGSAIKTLHNYGREWTEDDIIGTGNAIPESWTGENLARLLTLCGESVCVQLLGSKAINGRLDELAEIIVHLAKVHNSLLLSNPQPSRPPPNSGGSSSSLTNNPVNGPLDKPAEVIVHLAKVQDSPDSTPYLTHLSPNNSPVP